MADGDRISSLQSAWEIMHSQEEDAFQECLKLDRLSSEKTKEKSMAVRHWWWLASNMLLFFTRTRAQLDHELQPFPAFLFARLANVAEELSTGVVPSFVEDARAAKGKRIWLLGERKHIAWAVIYVEAVREGRISDPAFNKTVRQAYKVRAKTVQNWEQRRDELTYLVAHKHLSGDEIGKKMAECGAIYALIGRGAPGPEGYETT